MDWSPQALTFTFSHDQTIAAATRGPGDGDTYTQETDCQTLMGFGRHCRDDQNIHELSHRRTAVGRQPSPFQLGNKTSPGTQPRLKIKSPELLQRVMRAGQSCCIVAGRMSDPRAREPVVGVFHCSAMRRAPERFDGGEDACSEAYAQGTIVPREWQGLGIHALPTSIRNTSPPS